MTGHVGLPDRFGSRIEVVSREPMVGGFSAATKDRLRIVVAEHGQRVEQTAVLKRTSANEVAALRAASEVPSTAAFPRIIDAGVDADGPWILVPFYGGGPPESEALIPDSVVESLARMHVHYLTRPTPGQLPVIDACWWRMKCAIAVERLAVLSRPATRGMISQVTALRDERSVLDGLEEFPRTLIHGDVHRNNVLVDGDGSGHLIDWGGAFVGMPALDIVNLGQPGGHAYQIYARTWESLTGDDLDNAAWRRSHLVATVCINVKYVAFAARMFGDDAAESMLRRAVEALDQLDH